MREFLAANWVDLLVAVLALAGIVGGLKRGLSGEVARMVAVAVAGFAAWRLGEPVGDLLERYAGVPPEARLAAGVLVVFVAVFALMTVLRMVLARLMQFTFKGKPERIGGALCGLVRYSVVAAILLVLLSQAPTEAVRRAAHNSFTGGLVLAHLLAVYENLQQRVPGLGPVVDEAAEAAGDAKEGLGEAVPPIQDEPVPPAP